ncbi:MAG: lipopolysaccharide kinase InaA family protein [Granulosicoccus sp.]
MQSIITDRGIAIRVEEEAFASGTMKDVHRVEGGEDVLAVFREPLNEQGLDRLKALVDVYRSRIMEGPGGDELSTLYRWPRDTATFNGKTAVLVPSFDARYLFEHGSVGNDKLSIRGKEKQGKWFASAYHRNVYLHPAERGHWTDSLSICRRIAQAVRRLHAGGLAHSDLSYRNVLVDPGSGSACLIDIDGLVVPGKYAPDVTGTPDFIAPEVVRTRDLPIDDPQRIHPSIETDRHALAVLVYLYLTGRHPLRGKKIHDAEDADIDEQMAMGANALWIEHPTDSSNRADTEDARQGDLPWIDADQLPCQDLCGPILQRLFTKAFIEGLHTPHNRPTAEEWERALVQTKDLLIPCSNDECYMGHFVFLNTTTVSCPLCNTRYTHSIPVLNFYTKRTGGTFRPEGHQMVAIENKEILYWQTDRFSFDNERLEAEKQVCVARIERDGSDWLLVNVSGTQMMDATSNETIFIDERIELYEGVKILLSKEDGCRLAYVQLTNT